MSGHCRLVAQVAEGDFDDFVFAGAEFFAGLAVALLD